MTVLFVIPNLVYTLLSLFLHRLSVLDFIPALVVILVTIPTTVVTLKSLFYDGWQFAFPAIPNVVLALQERPVVERSSVPHGRQ